MSDPILPTSSSGDDNYVVVARRYRPRDFDELVGQQHIAHALTNAIVTHRVGHAYLFTGARGVGKTSTARIFAKALNAPDGPTPHPNPDTDICRMIDAGEDVDVLEIDGASNRGIEEIRQLRSNVNVRPSRSRFKIYIIDEVHMLTQAAFNALLKTLEEPPEHVKFIFCTTDPDKIPITVLSRCQRFDFMPVATDEIVGRLKHIVASEGRAASAEALRLLARKAAGSMRDSQSLLEQVLAFCDGPLDVDEVHRMLGTAGDQRLKDLIDALAAHDAAGALLELDRSAQEGVDEGQLAEQLLGYYRDLMTVAVQGSPELLRTVKAEDRPQLEPVSERLGLQGILAAIQILDQTLMRLRQSAQARTLVEMALVRICRLETLTELGQWIEALRQGKLPGGSAAPPPSQPAQAASLAQPRAGQPRAGQPQTGQPQAGQPAPQSPPPTSRVDPPAGSTTTSVDRSTAEGGDPAPPASKKKPIIPDPHGRETTASERVTATVPPDSPRGDCEKIWQQTVGALDDMTAELVGFAHGVAIIAPNRLVLSFLEGYTFQKESCERPELKARIEAALSRVTGSRMQLHLEVIPGPASSQAQSTPPKKSRRQRQIACEKAPFVREAMELFDAEVTRVEEPRENRRS